MSKHMLKHTQKHMSIVSYCFVLCSHNDAKRKETEMKRATGPDDGCRPNDKQMFTLFASASHNEKRLARITQQLKDSQDQFVSESLVELQDLWLNPEMTNILVHLNNNIRQYKV